MARRKPEKARQAAIKEGFTRLRCLIRNREFREDLVGLRRLKQEDRHQRYRAFLKKWDLLRFPKQLITGIDQLPVTVDGYEKVLAETQRDAETDPNPNNRFIYRPAVVASDPYELYIDDLLVLEDRTASDHTPPVGTVVNIQVDLSYPQDVLEAEIQSVLRAAKEKRHALEEQGRVKKRPERLRLDKVDFYLQVYDRAEGNEPYRTIAASLNQPKSTIQSAHVAAIRLVGSSTAFDKSAKPRRKTQSAREPFDFEKHIKECEACRAAESPRDYCAGCRSWVDTHIGPRFVPFDELLSDGSWRGEDDLAPFDEPLNVDAELPPGDDSADRDQEEHL